MTSAMGYSRKKSTHPDGWGIFKWHSHPVHYTIIITPNNQDFNRADMKLHNGGMLGLGIVHVFGYKRTCEATLHFQSF